MIEGVAVQLPEQAFLVSGDGGGSWGVVEQSKFSECFAGLIGLKEGGVALAREDLGTRERTRADDVQAIALVTFLDHDIIDADLALLHRVDNNVFLALV